MESLPDQPRSYLCALASLRHIQLFQLGTDSMIRGDVAGQPTTLPLAKDAQRFLTRLQTLPSG